MRWVRRDVLSHSLWIRATPEQVFAFLTGVVDDATYRAWHPGEHLSLQWVKGEPWRVGSVLYATERLGGRLRKMTLRVTRVIPGRRIDLAPLSRFQRRYAPRNTYAVRPEADGCRLTLTLHLRLPLPLRLLARAMLDRRLAAAKRHMVEEAEHLKHRLEGPEG
ncbi:MAG: hypothetical protein GX591_02815 [Planctomycetes bacterium]|nr:hypothetical protein [Planctomycetota bacterium]